MLKKFKKLEQKIQSKQTKPILCDPDVQSYLEALQKRFLVVTIDKDAKNYVFVCIEYITSVSSCQKLVFLTENLKHNEKLHIAWRK